MNKHLLFTLFLAFCSSVCLWAQGLRTSVCVVYPECTSEDSLVLTDLAKAMGSIGFTSDATSLRAYAGKSFGSGVLVDGLVLTNRHVVGYAKTAKLVFMLHDKTLTYEHCRVLSCSQSADIAALELPADATELHSLTLSNEAAQDGEDIFAAGFPGLNNEPSWQLTKGSVSNSILQVDGSDYIQHTAAIDPGSSGGPLLRKRDGKNEVIGLNTMKAVMRDRVGLAVNTTDIRLFLISERDTSNQAVLKLFEDVDATLLQEYYRMLPDSMKTVLHDMDVRLALDRVLSIADYYGGIEQLQKKAANKGVIDLGKADKRLTQNRVGVDYLRDEWSFFVEYNAFHPIKGFDSNGWTDQFISLGAESGLNYLLYGGSVSMPIVASNKGNLFGVSISARLGAHVPIRLNACHVLVPKLALDAQIGMLLTELGPYFASSLRAGMDYRYQFKKTSIVTGVHYLFVPICRSMLDRQPIGHGLSVSIGVAF